MKDHARHLTDAELTAEIEQIKNHIESGSISDEEKERNAYFNDPANAEAIKAQQTRMDLVIALHKARKAAGLTQKELAEKIGTKQTYIAQLERGRRNVTLATIEKYARACGKQIAITLI
ncbi:MAG: helix-turn-helix transcriptional regulator [Lentisphaerae bacterium]|nr:helix-turn-helix transcriptional regulator [Lentisphaerota bacterium]